jgi:hypothetical protein
MTPIDGMAGTYLVSRGESLHLYFDGRFYAPDSEIPAALAEATPGEAPNARDYVEAQLARRLGPVGRWPLTARFFLVQQGPSKHSKALLGSGSRSSDWMM